MIAENVMMNPVGGFSNKKVYNCGITNNCVTINQLFDYSDTHPP